MCGAQVVQIELVIAQQAYDSTHVQHAFEIVDVAAVTGHARMMTSDQLLDDVRPFVFEIDGVDFAARHHDVLDRDAFQIEDAEQHFAMLVRDHRTGFLDHGAQFLAAEGVGGARLGTHTEQAQCRVRDFVEHPDQRK